jgi:KUP system potassium uptake protein
VIGERAEVAPLGHGIHRLVLRFGFMEEPQVDRYVADVAHRLEPTSTPESVTYLLGHERLVAGPAGRMGRLAERLFAVLSRNASNPSDYFGLPTKQVVELGSRVDL